SGVIDALVVVMDRHCQNLLGVALSHHVVVQHLEDFRRRGNAFARLHERGLVFLADDFHAQFDAFIADGHGRARNQLADLVLALSAEGAIEGVLGLRSTRLAHSNSFPKATRNRSSRLARTEPESGAQRQSSNLYTTTIGGWRSRIV